MTSNFSAHRRGASGSKSKNLLAPASVGGSMDRHMNCHILTGQFLDKKQRSRIFETGVLLGILRRCFYFFHNSNHNSNKSYIKQHENEGGVSNLKEFRY